MRRPPPSNEKDTQAWAQGIIEERQRQGTWSGAVTPHTEYQTRPLDWIVDKLGIARNTIEWSLNPEYANHKWDGDKDPLVTLLQSLADSKDVGCESATGIGKTFIAACTVFWWLACFEDSIAITAAPKESQLFLHIWKEIGNLWLKFEAMFPTAQLSTGKIRMKETVEDRETWAATAFVAGVGADEEIAQKAKGFHREHMLWITEETTGLNPAFMNTIQHTRTDDHNLHLALGNPSHRNDPLHQFCLDEWVVHLRISAFDHPNVVCKRSVIKGAIGPERLKQRIAKCGEGSRLYLTEIRGISPAQAEDALIRWEWCQMAGRKYEDMKMREGELWMGGDVANSEDGDKAAIARGQGACCTEVVDFKCPDASELGVKMVNEARNKDHPVDPRHIGIDSVGVGAATVNTMKAMGMKVRHLSGARRAAPGLDEDLFWSTTETDLEGNMKATGPKVIDAAQFNNLRSCIWWRAREDLRLGNIALPPDPDLWDDLCMPTWETKNGRICVQSKEDIIKHLKRSPNKGDAFVYGNFVRRRIPTRDARKAKRKQKNRDRDAGLDKLYLRQAKREREEKRQMARFLKQRARARERTGIPGTRVTVHREEE